jgi:16S rRNA (guanine1207-N2)-methyltransferase
MFDEMRKAFLYSIIENNLNQDLTTYFVNVPFHGGFYEVVLPNICLTYNYSQSQLISKSKYKVVNTKIEENFQQVIVFGTNDKEETKELISLGWNNLELNGLLIVVLPNEWGGKSIPKLLENFSAEVNYISKFRCRVAWGKKTLNPFFTLSPSINNPFHTVPGLFSWREIDKGTELLLNLIPPNITGDVCDLGCGYGALGISLAKREAGISSITGVDIDARAISMWELNLEKFNIKIGKSLWFNISELYHNRAYHGRYNVVIANIPWHTEGLVDRTLVDLFLNTAKVILKSGGELYVVGQREAKLPDIFEKLFKKSTILANQKGYIIVKGYN